MVCTWEVCTPRRSARQILGEISVSFGELSLTHPYGGFMDDLQFASITQDLGGIDSKLGTVCAHLQVLAELLGESFKDRKAAQAAERKPPTPAATAGKAGPVRKRAGS